MRKLIVILAALAVLSTACGDRGDDNSGGVGGESATTEGGGEAAAGDWGDLEGVCGPEEGGGEVPAEDAQGISEDTIKLGTVADPGFAARLGLNQEMFDAGDAFVAWCNAAGGINGKKLELTKHDAKLTEYQPVIEDACRSDFALVGGGAVQDNLWPSIGVECDLIDVPGFAVTADKAGLAGDSPERLRQIQPVPNAADRYLVGTAQILLEEHPGVEERMGFVFSDFQTLISQKNKESEAYASLGAEVVHEGVYNVMGEANWKPFATALENDRVSLLKFVGEPNNGGALEQAMAQVGYVPELRIYEANFYAESFLESGGPAVEGAYTGIVFNPLEEADRNPATQLYIDNVEEQGGKVALLGVQSTSAWLLFATLAKACDLDNNLTRSCILEEGAKVTEWTGGGLHAPTNPGENLPSECTVVLVVKDGEFVRYAPEDEGFACDPGNVAEVTP